MTNGGAVPAKFARMESGALKRAKPFASGAWGDDQVVTTVYVGAFSWYGGVWS